MGGAALEEKVKPNTNLSKAQEALDNDHFGLKAVERIIESIAVNHHVAKMKGPILCLVRTQVLVKSLVDP